jgi:hypothetical protein
VPLTSGAEADDAMRESMGYNYSIYLMAGMPYLLLVSVGGFFVYYGLRKKPAADPPPQGGAEGLSPCPPESTAEDL